MQGMKIFGIDLGTTYSCIAHIDEFEKPEVIKDPLDNNRSTIASVVLFEPDKVVVGQNAKKAFDSAERIIEFAKRYMGEADLDKVPFSHSVEGKILTPHYVSAQVLAKLKDNAEQTLNLEKDSVKNVVITVPAYFGAEEIKATKMAGEIAGLNVIETISEPTAAVLSHYAKKGDIGSVEKNVVAYDLGGGTFDVTFMSLKGGEIKEVYTAGSPRLGGKDWDDALVILVLEKRFAVQFSQKEVGDLRVKADEGGEDWQDLLVLKMKEKCGEELEDAGELFELRLNCETAKRDLTSLSKTSVRFARKSIDVTQEEFNEKTKDLLDLTMMKFQQVLDAASERGFPDFDEILLVGGSAKMPQVAAMLQQQFGKPLVHSELDLAVATGAAIYAQYKVDAAGTGRELKVSRICSKSYGTTALDQSGVLTVFNLVKKSSPVPDSWTEDSFGTVVKDQRNINFTIMQSDSERETLPPEQAMEIGSGTMSLPPGLDAGTQVKIDFVLSADGDITLIGHCAGETCEVRAKFAIEMSAGEMEIAKKETAASITRV